MPTAPIAAALTAISTGLAVLAVGMLTLTLVAAGLCQYFSWLDLHIGAFIKKIFWSAISGSAFVGGAAATAAWAKGVFGLP